MVVHQPHLPGGPAIPWQVPRGTVAASAARRTARTASPSGVRPSSLHRAAHRITHALHSCMRRSIDGLHGTRGSANLLARSAQKTPKKVHTKSNRPTQPKFTGAKWRLDLRRHDRSAMSMALMSSMQCVWSESENENNDGPVGRFFGSSAQERQPPCLSITYCKNAGPSSGAKTPNFCPRQG